MEIRLEAERCGSGPVSAGWLAAWWANTNPMASASELGKANRIGKSLGEKGSAAGNGRRNGHFWRSRPRRHRGYRCHIRTRIHTQTQFRWPGFCPLKAAELCLKF